MGTSLFRMVFSQLLAELVQQTPRLVGEGSLVQHPNSCNKAVASIY